jgi:uroporphyrinogen decarboxylase
MICMGSLTPKERMLAAMRREEPDRVPVAPDISNMVPAKLTGKPFWKIYRDRDPPLWRAYLRAARLFGIDAWMTYGALQGARESDGVSRREEVVTTSHDRLVVRNQVSTPDGDLWDETVFFRDHPPWPSKRRVTDLVADFPKLMHLFPDPSTLNDDELQLMKRETGDSGVVGGGVALPTIMYCDREGGVGMALRDYLQHHRLLMKLVRASHRQVVEVTKRLCDSSPDFILIGNSGMWLMQGERITRDVSLPTLKAVTRIASRKDVPTLLHCCGPERGLVEICARESDLDCINPVERPPLGDCDLAEIKESFGDRLSFMGNLPTTTLMFRGSPQDVLAESRMAMDAIGQGGGFILSTGDQCPRDTPHSNILAMVEAAERYGRYR